MLFQHRSPFNDRVSRINFDLNTVEDSVSLLRLTAVVELYLLVFDDDDDRDDN